MAGSLATNRVASATTSCCSFSSSKAKLAKRFYRWTEKQYLCAKVRILSVYVHRITLRKQHSPYHLHPGSHHCPGHLAGQGQTRRRHAGGYVDPFYRHRFRPFQDGHRPESARFRQGIRFDPIHLFGGYAGRSGLFFFAQTEWTETQPGFVRRPAGWCAGDLSAGVRQRYEPRHDDRRNVGCRDQHAGFGIGPADLSGHDGRQRTFHLPGLCRGLSARRHRPDRGLDRVAEDLSCRSGKRRCAAARRTCHRNARPRPHHGRNHQSAARRQESLGTGAAAEPSVCHLPHTQGRGGTRPGRCPDGRLAGRQGILRL